VLFEKARFYKIPRLFLAYISSFPGKGSLNAVDLKK
jgi:hypothetical protein